MDFSGWWGGTLTLSLCDSVSVVPQSNAVHNTHAISGDVVQKNHSFISINCFEFHIIPPRTECVLLNPDCEFRFILAFINISIFFLSLRDCMRRPFAFHSRTAQRENCGKTKSHIARIWPADRKRKKRRKNREHSIPKNIKYLLAWSAHNARRCYDAIVIANQIINRPFYGD